MLVLEGGSYSPEYMVCISPEEIIHWESILFAQPSVFQQPGMATVLARNLRVLPSWFQWQAVTGGGSVALHLLS